MEIIYTTNNAGKSILLINNTEYDLSRWTEEEAMADYNSDQKRYERGYVNGDFR